MSYHTTFKVHTPSRCPQGISILRISLSWIPNLGSSKNIGPLQLLLSWIPYLILKEYGLEEDFDIEELIAERDW